MDFDFIEDEEQRAKAVTAYKESIDTIKGGMETQIQEAISALKQKNDDIISEKRTLQEKLDGFKDLNPDEIKIAMEKAKKAEEEKMTAEERAAKKVSDLKNDHSMILEEMQSKLDSATKNEVEFKNKFEGKVIEDDLRAQAVSAGVRPEAVEDVVMQGRAVFSLGEDGSVEARGADNSLLKNNDGIIMTSKVWMDGMKKDKSYFWPGSTGADMTGRHGSTNDENVEKMAALLDKGDFAGYKALKAKLAK